MGNSWKQFSFPSSFRKNKEKTVHTVITDEFFVDFVKLADEQELIHQIFQVQ